jgi:hypothetical protein
MRNPTAIVFIALGLTCCARPPTPTLSSSSESMVPINMVDEQPRLLACTGYPPPGRPNRNLLPTYSVGILLSLVVTSDGTVASGSAAPLTASASTIDPTPSDLSRALAMAKTCQYQPATLQGRAVSVSGLLQGIILEPR